MRARYYDTDTGRFTSRDPIGFEGGDLNLYAYVGEIRYPDLILWVTIGWLTIVGYIVIPLGQMTVTKPSNTYGLRQATCMGPGGNSVWELKKA